MLFDSSIRKELARSFGATLVVLVTVVMTMMLIRTLGQASKGSVSPSDVMLVMGFTVLGQLPTILSLSLFIAVVGTLSRMYRDSEMVIWFASGRGLISLLRPLLRFAWPVMVVIAVLSLLVWPWANSQIQELKTRYEQRSDIDRIAPGEFQESSNGSRVFFIDKDSPDTQAGNNIFIAATDGARESVTSARSARLETRGGERMAVLSEGQRLETSRDKPGVKISEFSEYGTRIGSAPAGSAEELSVKTRATHELLMQPLPAYRAELGWRLGLALAAINFVVLGLAVASVNPRAARSTSLVFALFAFIVYYNLMTLGQSWVGRTGAEGYQLSHAFLFVVLSIPSHLYELLPITVLIGTIFVMARLAQSSEFTIMRTSGMGPWRALRTLVAPGGFFVLLTFAVGDYIAPLTDRAAQLVKVRYLGRLTTGATGAWLKERQDDHSYAVNVRALTPNGGMLDVRIFEFDAKGRLASQTRAASGQFGPDGAWNLEQVQRSRFEQRGNDEARVEHLDAPTLQWPTRISADMVAASLLKPDRMATIDLFQYIRHLDANGQSAQRYEIEFWRKVFYPLSCLVMVVLALPFAYLHFRSGGIAGYVFGGVMAGISFFLLNNVFGYAGNLQNWSPWLTAAAPGLIYSVLSLAAFGWLVLRR